MHGRDDGRRDRWSPAFPATAGAVALAFWCAGLTASLSLGFLAVVAGAVTAIAAAVACLILLVSRHWRGAACAASAPLIMAGGLATAPTAVEQARGIDFALHRERYEATVRAWRAAEPGVPPFRLVVDGVDRSVFLTDIFDTIVYDESDAVGDDPDVFSGVWPCAIPGWGSRVMFVGGGRKSAKRLGGHFYLVDQVE